MRGMIDNCRSSGLHYSTATRIEVRAHTCTHVHAASVIYFESKQLQHKMKNIDKLKTFCSLIQIHRKREQKFIIHPKCQVFLNKPYTGKLMLQLPVNCLSIHQPGVDARDDFKGLFILWPGIVFVREQKAQLLLLPDRFVSVKNWTRTLTFSLSENWRQVLAMSRGVAWL